MKTFFIMLIFVLCSCQVLGPKPSSDNVCSPNFTTSGSLSTGGVINKCSKEYPNTSKKAAFNKILASVAAHGYNIVNSDKEQGLITVTLPGTATTRSAKQAPMNILILDGSNKGIRVDAIINLAGGNIVTGNELTGYFCSVYQPLENAEKTTATEEPAPAKKTKRNRRKK
ncbi:MAG: hypothetical protein PHY82_04020 [Lentisphaeria bacterium]|nr:hypothetical protein [Lentisphaeria bacterium]NLX50856.1 hypothetical protein [Deltaproteobacteria bacterium]